MLNFGSSLSERRYLRTVFLDRPARRDISRIEKWSRKCQRRMTLNNSMSITPLPPGQAKGVRFEHGSVLGGKIPAARVSSQRKSTTGDLIVTRGIYLFTENGKHLYVGRSNRLLARYKN